MRPAIAVPILLVIASRTPAQLNDSGHSAFLSGGISGAAVNKINDVLGSPGKTFSPEVAALGGGLYLVHHGWLVAPTGTWSRSKDVEGVNGRRTSMNRDLFDASVGRLVYRSDGAAIFPELGVGWGRSAIGITKGTPADPAGTPGSFEFAATDPTSPTHLTRNGLVETAAVRVEEMILRREHGAGERGIALGLVAGYRVAQDLGSWNANGQSVSGGPRSALTGVFAMITLGPVEWNGR